MFFRKTFSNIFLILLIDYHIILCICLIRLKKNFFKLDYIINKLVNMSYSDHMTELNDSDHINKLVDMSQSDHMTVLIFNENSINEIYKDSMINKILLFMNNIHFQSFFIQKSCCFEIIYTLKTFSFRNLVVLK